MGKHMEMYGGSILEEEGGWRMGRTKELRVANKLG